MCIPNSGWQCLETHGPLENVTPCFTFVVLCEDTGFLLLKLHCKNNNNNNNNRQKITVNILITNRTNQPFQLFCSTPPRPKTHFFNLAHLGHLFPGFIRVLRHDSEDAFCGVDTDPSKGRVDGMTRWDDGEDHFCRMGRWNPHFLLMVPKFTYSYYGLK